MTRSAIIIAGLLLLVGGRIAVGQSEDERGIPFPSEHYAPPEYQQSSQNWDVVQDARGLIYVANNDGVLQYDGERWRLIPTTTGTFVRSLAADSLIYVGAKGDFGYLRPDSLGVLRYQSLYEHIPKDKRDFDDVWGTHATENGVYFQSNAHLFRWNGETMKVWSSEEGFHTSFVVGGQLYVRDFKRGLLRMEGDSLEVVPGGKAFHETPIYMMARHPSGDLLVGTQKKGLLLYDGETFRDFAPGLTPYLQENDLYHGCRLPGNRYVLATLGGGAVVIDAAGDVVRVLDGSSGVPDPVVNAVYSDRRGQLWMALNSKGVFRANLNTPSLTLHDERTGLEGTIRDIYEHGGTTYVATRSGFYVLQEQENPLLRERNARFVKRKSVPLAWAMSSVGGTLLVGTQENGVYQVSKSGERPVADWKITYDLQKAKRKTVYAGAHSGLNGLTWTQTGWVSFSIEKIQEEIRSLVSEEEGVLWASTIGGEVLRVVLSDDGKQALRVTRYGPRSGLPDGYKGLETINGRMTIVSKEGLFQVENPDQAPASWRFSRRPSLLPDVEDTLSVEAVEGTGDRLWVVLEKRVFVGRFGKEGVSEWRSIEPLHFPKSKQTALHVRDSTVWLGDGRRLFRYAPEARPKIERSPVAFRSFVRQVTTLRRGRIVYGGSRSGLADSVVTVPYGRDLRIDVAAPLYDTITPHEYRYKLSGRTDQWTGWMTQASQRYRNLWEGTYRFQVQARNDRGEQSTVASLTLRIQPPWYRSIWAYLVYGIAFVATAYGYRRYYRVKEERRRAEERVRELERERVVAERLKRANERLREANRLKEDFLATTSHELRTPLTNILGSIEVLRDTVNGENEEFLDMIERNGKRLKRTLNALLDLSMLRSGEEEMEQTPVPVDECVREVAADLRADAEEKGLAFRTSVPDAPLYAELDEQYLEQILRNLIENAIKFTEEGHVEVSTGQRDGRVYVEVADTGIGIDEDFLPDLFDEFKQESRGRARAYEGNGLGLAISARLTERMGGSIAVESEKNEGSVFTVEFPRSSETEGAGTEDA